MTVWGEKAVRIGDEFNEVDCDSAAEKLLEWWSSNRQSSGQTYGNTTEAWNEERMSIWHKNFRTGEELKARREDWVHRFIVLIQK